MDDSHHAHHLDVHPDTLDPHHERLHAPVRRGTRHLVHRVLGHQLLPVDDYNLRC